MLFSCRPANDQREGAVSSREGAKETGLEVRDSSRFYFAYNLDNPNTEMELSKGLREISGLSLSYDGLYLLAVNDEEGKVFFLEKERGRAVHEIAFGGPGDYEGVEMVGRKLYIARSDGVIFEVEYRVGRDAVAKSHYTALNEGHDVEGLAYDKANHRLLVACKGQAGEGEALENKRAAYSFSLDSMLLSEAPVYLIGKDMPIAGEAIPETWWEDALDGKFAPSAIAVHPVSGNIYLLSSKGKARAILVLSPSGELIHLQELNKSPFSQPEGLCFEPDGAMYISTEAKGKRGKGRIFRFEMY